MGPASRWKTDSEASSTVVVVTATSSWNSVTKLEQADKLEYHHPKAKDRYSALGFGVSGTLDCVGHQPGGR